MAVASSEPYRQRSACGQFSWKYSYQNSQIDRWHGQPRGSQPIHLTTKRSPLSAPNTTTNPGPSLQKEPGNTAPDLQANVEPLVPDKFAINPPKPLTPAKSSINPTNPLTVNKLDAPQMNPQTSGTKPLVPDKPTTSLPKLLLIDNRISDLRESQTN